MDDAVNTFRLSDRPSLERIHDVVLSLTSPVRSRLRRFMNRQEFAGMHPSEIISILLDREEVHPENTHSYALRRRRPQSSQYPNQGAMVQQQESQPPLAAYCYDSLRGTRRRRSLITYGQDEPEVMVGYGENFAEEGEILDEEDEEHALNDTVDSDGRLRLGQRLQYYSAHDKIVPGLQSDILVGRMRSRKSVQTQLQPRVLPGQKQWTSALRRHWYALVVKWQQNGMLHCRICGICMDVVVRGIGLRAGNAFDHACKHLDRPLFVCRICSQQTISSTDMRDHVRGNHQADARSFVDFMDGYHAELEAMIVHCFEPMGSCSAPAVRSITESVASRSGLTGRRKKKKRRQGPTGGCNSIYSDSSTHAAFTARQFCYQMIIKWQRNNALYCRRCDQWLRVAAKNNWLRSETAMQHICGHLGKPLYKCRSCPQIMATSRQIRQHLQTVHKSGIRGQYIDLTESCQEELKEIAACCFDWMEDEDGPPINEGRFLRPRLRTDLESNVGRREALVFCRSLIQSNSVSGRMECRLCTTSFVATTTNGYPLAETVYNHSLKHIDPAPYACRVCAKRTHNSANMRSHIWTKHKDIALTEFDDFTSQMENEIVDVLTQCFSLNGGGGTEIIEQDVSAQNVLLVGQQETGTSPVYVKQVVSTPHSVLVVTGGQDSISDGQFFDGSAGGKEVPEYAQN